MKEILEKTFKENNFEINGEKIDKFNDFFNLLLKFNENINLTRITSPEDAAKNIFSIRFMRQITFRKILKLLMLELAVASLQFL